MPAGERRMARQRTPEPAAHGVDRGGADDRSRARDARRDARRGHRPDVHGRRERDLRRATTRSRRRTTSRPIPIDAAEAAAKAPGVVAVGSVRTGETLVFGKTEIRDRRRPGRDAGDQARLGRGLASRFRELRRGRSLRRRRTTRRSTISQVGSPVEVTFANGDKGPSSSRGSSTHRPAARRSARHDLDRGVGRREPDAEEHLLVRARWRVARRTRTRPRSRRREAVPEREGRRRARSSSTTRSRASDRSSTSSTSCSGSRSSSACSGSSTPWC